MKCKHARGMLVNYVNEVLEPGYCRQLEEHIAECKACSQELDTLKKLLGLIDNVKVEYPPASMWENFLPDLHKRIENEAALIFRKQKRRRFYALPGWAATAAAMLFLFAATISQDHSIVNLSQTDDTEIAQDTSRSAADESLESSTVAGIISNTLITEAEAQKLKELSSTDQTEVPVFPYSYQYDDENPGETSDKAEVKADKEDVIQFLQEKFKDYDENLMEESDESIFGAI